MLSQTFTQCPEVDPKQKHISIIAASAFPIPCTAKNNQGRSGIASAAGDKSRPGVVRSRLSGTSAGLDESHLWEHQEWSDGGDGSAFLHFPPGKTVSAQRRGSCRPAQKIPVWSFDWSKGCSSLRCFLRWRSVQSHLSLGCHRWRESSLSDKVHR